MEKSNKSNALRAGIWYTIVNYLTKGAIFLTTPIFTRILTKAEVGTYGNFASWFSVLVPLVTFDLCVSLGVARFDYKKELESYISSVLVYGTTITAAIYLIVCLRMDFFCRLFTLQPYMIHILFIYLLVYPAMQAFQSENMFKYRYKTTAVISLSSFVLSLSAAILLTLLASNKLAGRIIGNFVTLTVFCLGIYIYLLHRNHHISLKYFKYAFIISFPMIWHSLSIQLLALGDRIVITRLIGEEANALYTTAYTCSQLVAVLYLSMNNAWSPWSTERMNTGETDVMKKASRYYILFFCVIVIGAMLICPELLLIMGGKPYLEAKFVLPPVLAACVCQFVYSLYINAEFYLKKQTRIAVGTILAAGINLGLNFIFVPRFGYVAAAYTTLAGYFCLYVFHLVSLMLLRKKDWYDNLFNTGIVLVFVAVMFFMNLLYKHDIARYIIAGVLGTAVITAGIIKRKLIKEFLLRFVFHKTGPANSEDDQKESDT